MQPSKEQVVHDLAMACVNGIVMNKVMQENAADSFSPNGADDVSDFVTDVLLGYEKAYNMIFSQIVITDDD